MVELPEGTFISADEAAELKNAFQEQCGNGVSALPSSFHYSKEKLLMLLSNPETYGIRIYAGMGESNELRTVLVATDAEGHDLLDSELPCLDHGQEMNPSEDGCLL